MSAQIGSAARPALRWEWRGKPQSYTVTPEDRLWFSRCLWREGKPAIAVGFTLLQRFVTVHDTYPTLSGYLRAYCQPVNPLWFPGGSKSEEAIKRAQARGDQAAVENEKARAKKRVQYAATPIDKIPAQYVTLVDDIFAGKLSSPVPTATHFTMSFAAAGDTEETARKKGEAFAAKRKLQLVQLPEGYRQGVNWFFQGAILPPEIRFEATKGSLLTMLFLLMPWTLIFYWISKKR